MDDLIISVENLTKTYNLYKKPSERVLEAFHPLKKRYHTPFDALKDISFDVRRGESFGIIGKNGSGKSTLLQIISGILQPTSGAVYVDGRVAALLELGAGFNPDFTGRENVYINGQILGFSREQMDEKFDDIAAFADIGAYLDQPVKTYSSGMYVRLAFAVQTFVEPDILIIDEALSVGDIFFQQKCLRRMNELHEQNTTLLFVSHDMGIVRKLCDKAVYLQQGELVYCGSSYSAVQKYYENNNQQEQAANIPAADAGSAGRPLRKKLIENQIWWGNPAEDEQQRGDAEILAVSMSDRDGLPSMRAQMGDEVTFKVLYRSYSERPMNMTMSIRNRFNSLITCHGTFFCGMEPLRCEKGGISVVSFTVKCDIEAGNYTLKFELSYPGELPNRGESVHQTDWIGPFAVEWDYENVDAPFLGMVHLPIQCATEQADLIG